MTEMQFFNYILTVGLPLIVFFILMARNEMKILIDEQVVQQALDALEPHSEYTQVSRTGDSPVVTYENDAHKAITALRTAIEQAEKQEPTTVVHNTDTPGHFATITPALPAGTKLYTHPAPAVPEVGADKTGEK